MTKQGAHYRTRLAAQLTLLSVLATSTGCIVISFPDSEPTTFGQHPRHLIGPPSAHKPIVLGNSTVREAILELETLPDFVTADGRAVLFGYEVEQFGVAFYPMPPLAAVGEDKASRFLMLRLDEHQRVTRFKVYEDKRDADKAVSAPFLCLTESAEAREIIVPSSDKKLWFDDYPKLVRMWDRVLTPYMPCMSCGYVHQESIEPPSTQDAARREASRRRLEAVMRPPKDAK